MFHRSSMGVRMIRCNHCGKEIEDGLILCPYCSGYLDDDDTVIEKILSDDPSDGLISGQEAFDPSLSVSSSQAADETSESIPLYSGEVADEDPTEAEVREIMKVVLAPPNDDLHKRRCLLCYSAAILISALLLFSVCRFIFRTPLVRISETVEAAPYVDPISLATLREPDKDNYNFSVKSSDLISDAPGDYSVTYTVINKKTLKTRDLTFRYEVVDTTAPVISASATLQIMQGDTFRIADFVTVSDNAQGVTIKQLYVGGTVDTDVPGNYPLTLSLTDASGNTTIVNLVVVVMQRTAQDTFFDLIYGDWARGSVILHIGTKNGSYYLETGTKSGTLVYDALSDNNETASFVWEWTDSNAKQPTGGQTNITFHAANARYGNISVNLSDGNGYRTYQKTIETHD